jgi:RNase P subunit RPR2
MRYYICKKCGEKLMGMKALRKHHKDAHPESNSNGSYVSFCPGCGCDIRKLNQALKVLGTLR